jgi:aspartate aminotransferase-like enzyme
MLLLIPGPVNVPKSVIEASKSLTNHRSEEFKEVVNELESILIKILDAERVALLSGSGTLAVESMIYSLIKKSQKVIAVSYGEFGDRMIESIRRRGANPILIRKKMGDYVKLDEIKEVVESNKDADYLAIVHNETSSGISIRNIDKVIKISKDHGLGVLIDSVSGLFAYEFYVNRWKVDAVASASQKALASIPGVGIVALSNEGIERLNSTEVPTYLDVSLHLKFQDKSETAFTPTIGAFYASLQAARILMKEGILNRIKRHEANALFVRELLSFLDFKLLGNKENYSNTVVAAFPSKFSVNELIQKLKFKQIIITSGMGELKDKIIRLGILGMIDFEALNILKKVLEELYNTKLDIEPPNESKLPDFISEELEWHNSPLNNRKF